MNQFDLNKLNANICITKIKIDESFCVKKWNKLNAHIT